MCEYGARGDFSKINCQDWLGNHNQHQKLFRRNGVNLVPLNLLKLPLKNKRYGDSKKELFDYSKSLRDNTADCTPPIQVENNASPVERMLARKLQNIKPAKIELNNAKTNKENFQRELTTALNHNSGSLSICGKWHLKIGHNRHVCDGEQCTSAMLCGIIDKHPDDKAKLRSLSQKVEKSKAEITKL